MAEVLSLEKTLQIQIDKLVLGHNFHIFVTQDWRPEPTQKFVAKINY